MDIQATGTAYESPFQAPLFNMVTLDPSRVLTILFFFIFVLWAVYSIVAAYHWFKYSHRSWVAVPAVALYVCISGLLILYIATSV